MKSNTIELVKTNILKPSHFHNTLYGSSEELDDLFIKSIEQHGIKTPLLVSSQNVIISGVLRHRVAIKLGLEMVPVIFSDKPLEEYQIAMLNLGRKKLPSIILREYQLLKPLFQVGKGCRTDIIKANSKLDVKETLGVSQNTIQRMCNIDKFAKNLYGSEDSEEYKNVWKKIDSGETNISKTEKRLKNQLEVKESFKDFPKGTYSTADFVIYQSDSKNLGELEDGSIQTIITSPPYFQVKNYNIGEEQLGKESEPYLFTVNLANHFDDCFRVLNSKGSLFVNLGDYVVNGEYKFIPAHFGLEMSKRGWKINDVIIWAKNNPRPNLAKRTICSTEYIIHFVKSTHFYYNLDWLKELGAQDKTSSLKTLFHGFSGSNTQLRSFLDFRGDNVILSNAANTHKLREKCKELGVSIIHDSTFPEILPEIFIRTTSVEGQTILDIFNGTSTTGVVAKVLQRKYVGYELNPEYIFQSKVRVETLFEDTKQKLLKSA